MMQLTLYPSTYVKQYHLECDNWFATSRLGFMINRTHWVWALITRALKEYTGPWMHAKKTITFTVNGTCNVLKCCVYMNNDANAYPYVFLYMQCGYCHCTHRVIS